MGANLAAAVMVVGTLGTPLEASQVGQAMEVVEPLVADSVVVTTAASFKSPLEVVDISQGFRGGHRGIDMRVPLGTAVYPIAMGKVAQVVNGRLGYGKRVVVDHENGLKSLYAHLGKITVVEGEEVTQETVLGEVGLTGWTTGPHLHLEVYEQGRAINPRQVVPLTL